MRTIRAKLFLIFSGCMLVMILTAILLNQLFLESYYIYVNRGVLSDVFQRMDTDPLMPVDQMAKELGQIDRAQGINSTLVDSQLRVRFNSFPDKGDANNAGLPLEIEGFIQSHRSDLVGSGAFGVVDKPNEQVRRLVYVKSLRSGDLLILKKSMEEIEESAQIANQFHAWTGSVVLVLGCVVVFFFSQRLVRPITEASQMAKAMANLDFSKVLQVTTKDEIGSLRQSINELSQKLNRSIGELTADVDRRKLLVRNMSHELKTPISIVKGYSEGLKFGLAQGPEQIQKYCDVIVMECDRMDRLVKEMLDLSQLEAGVINPQVETLNIADIFDSLRQSLTPQITTKGIVIQFLGADGLQVRADALLVERALMNYLTNAMHHAEGTMEIMVKAVRCNSEVVIEVFNTGKTISDDDMERIWDVFFTCDQARRRSYEGHGLGLSIVKLIVQAHGGRVWMHNQENGVSFYLSLPCA